MESLQKQSSNLNPTNKPAKNRDARRFERKERRKSFFRRFFISSGTIVLVLVIGGIVYTWYMGRNIDTSAIQEPIEAEVRKNVGPTQPAENTPVSASVQSLNSPITPGMNVAMTVRTKPKSTCSVTFIYNEIASTDSGLTDKIADEYGIVSWSWTVDKNVPIGTWPAKVTCVLGEKSAVVVGNVEVVLELD